MRFEVRNLSKKYGKHEVLKNVSFAANTGECVGILGGNGSGKTTLLSALAGMCSGVKGEVIWEGGVPQFAYVPQQNPLMEELTARDNLRLWYKKDIIDASLQNGLLGRLGIAPFIDKSVSELSGGMKKRLAIGCAMSNNAPIVLLDEPTASLDLQAKQELYQLFDELRKGGRLILLVTHDKEEIEFCDKLFLFCEGVLNPYEYNGDAEKLARDICR